MARIRKLYDPWKGTSPWHGLGVDLDPTDTVDTILTKAGLDWTVSVESVRVRGKAFTKQKIIVRDDNNLALGWCGSRYKAIQNRDAFSFFTKYLKAGGLHLETAGCLDGGRRGWGLAKLHDSFTLAGDDRVEAYLLLSHPHIWGHAGTFMFTPIRVCCKNTMNLALGEQDRKKKTRFLHYVPWSEETILQVERDIGRAKELMLDFRDKAALLSSAGITEEQLLQYIGDLFMRNKEARVDELDLTPITQRLLALVDTCPGAQLASAKGTWWGAFNTVSFYVDHEAGKNCGQDNPDKRLNQAWFGLRGYLKTRAYNLAVKRAKEHLKVPTE